MKLPHHGRYDYIPLPKRKTYEWPGGKRLAFCINNNIEHFAFMAGLGGDQAIPGSPQQNQRNYAWREYGNRVGIWYYFDLLDAYRLPASHNVNSAVLDACPEIAARMRERGDEFIGHGRSNAERQDGLWEEDEARLIRECTDVIARHAGRSPQGWLGPWLAQGRVTPDLLQEAGYSYMMDWPADDQPFWVKTRSGRILSVPYPIELNDVPAMITRQHTGAEFEQMIKDQFDEMLRQSEKYPLVFAITCHPFVVGQPFRLAALRRALDHVLGQRDKLWLTTPGEIARYCASLPAGVVPGS
jgi:peptidoglycan/xylan/chitin deacetylase (PgdA/CDA1 family)